MVDGKLIVDIVALIAVVCIAVQGFRVTSAKKNDSSKQKDTTKGKW